MAARRIGRDRSLAFILYGEQPPQRRKTMPRFDGFIARNEKYTSDDFKKRHERWVGHVVEYEDGTTEDLASLVDAACEEDAHYRVVLENDARHVFPDGTEIVGQRIARSPRSGRPEHRELPHPQFDITYNARYGDVRSYTARLRRDHTVRRITQYVRIDGEIVEERRKFRVKEAPAPRA